MNSKFNEFTDTELAQEQWRDIEGYDGAYQVSDLGRVRSRKSGEWKMLRSVKNRDGYLHLNLSKGNKVKTFYVHRLVAQAFIPNDDETKTQINHRNECKSENKVSNLEYCTAQYNSTYNDIHHRHMVNYHRSNYRRNAIKDLYDPNLSIKKNIEIFKANGVECCKDTVVKLRKDLGITKQITKIDKVKRLYRPDLSINENIELFKSNGIECSRNTVLKLRKYLGLTKQYRPRKKTN